MRRIKRCCNSKCRLIRLLYTKTDPMDIDIKKLQRHKFKKIRWIYYLFDKWELVYVGQSESVIPRINTHTRDKQFDEYSYVEIEKGISMDEIEMNEIKKYRPKYNKFIQERRSRGRLESMFNLLRRQWYKAPNVTEKTLNMTNDELVVAIMKASGISQLEAEIIVNMGTEEINKKRKILWPMQILYNNKNNYDGKVIWHNAE